MEENVEEIPCLENCKDKHNQASPQHTKGLRHSEEMNIPLHGVEEGAGIKTSGSGKIFTKIVAENLPGVEEDTAVKYKRL